MYMYMYVIAINGDILILLALKRQLNHGQIQNRAGRFLKSHVHCDRPTLSADIYNWTGYAHTRTMYRERERERERERGREQYFRGAGSSGISHLTHEVNSPPYTEFLHYTNMYMYIHKTVTKVLEHV